jgi:hypothetical protein
MRNTQEFPPVTAHTFQGTSVIQVCELPNLKLGMKGWEDTSTVVIFVVALSSSSPFIQLPFL